MCAINGVLGKKEMGEVVGKMNTATRHRGPDGTGVYQSGLCTLGHNRLAIIDLSEYGAQPMKSTFGRYVVTFNGEIYNYKELKNELRNQYTFRTQSDTEVLLAAYEKWGLDCVNKIAGIFAFAIWDNKKQQCFISRDQMGVKPLYYSWDDNSGVLTFSSELQGLLAGGDHVELDQDALYSYLAMHYVLSPQCMIKGVQKLEPGHYMLWDKFSLKIKRYFYPDLTKKESEQNLYECIDSVVAGQTVADREQGVFLSGGLDSSIVLHHLVKYVPKIKTYSTSFEMVEGFGYLNDRFNADAEIARETASYYGVAHSNFSVSLQDVRENIEFILGSIDEPVANPTTIAKYFLSKHSRENGAIVTYGGMGGDELFTGYDRHTMMYMAQKIEWLPARLRQLAGLYKQKYKRLGAEYPAELHRLIVTMENSAINRFLKNKKDIAAITKELFAYKYSQINYVKDKFEQYLISEREMWLVDEALLQMDKMTMLSGQEHRVPLLDIGVVYFADTMRVDDRIDRKQTKKLLRSVYRDYLPKHVFEQPKRGWQSPGSTWLRDPVINKFAQQVFSNDYCDSLKQYIDWNEVQLALREHKEQKKYLLYPLWDLFVLQIWLKRMRTNHV